MNLMCRQLPENLTLFSFVKTERGPWPEIFSSKPHHIDKSRTIPAVHSHPWNIRKPSKDEDVLKNKLLKHQKNDILEFDQEKHLIKSFILAHRKQGKLIDRDKKLVYSKQSRDSSLNSNRSYNVKSHRQSGNSKKVILSA